ncbi:MAG TPA: choice-of-anchor tandem repeat GloVer-containing protein [Rhizomicrobium sp.]|nr:choice-of-anchor tandem repeat GloVer-containing protein [Rhizomicrobium sp.]
MQVDVRKRNYRSLAGTIVSLCLFTLSGVAPSVAGEKVMHAFAGGEDGLTPFGALAVGAHGKNMYGGTEGGGTGTGCYGDTGCGTIYEITPTGLESVLYSFQGGADGISPAGKPLIDSSGNLFGVTAGGGGNGCIGYGCGTIYKLAPDGTETVLYAFQGQADGSFPMSGLVADANGDLFGTTTEGGNYGSNCGSYGCGTVFELQPDGKLITLYAFQDESDGTTPPGGVIIDSAGNLYGTAQGGGTNCDCGVVFEITAGGTYAVLYAFQGGSDGYSPRAGLIADTAGNLYGTTISGGDTKSCTGGCGTVFKVTPGGHETVLYGFHAGSDGANPVAGVIRDAKGNIYGTTWLGGGRGKGCKNLFGDGCGTVFKLTPKGEETVLVHFYNKHGQFPQASLLLGKNGELYGTTTEGGKFKQGVVFKVKK